MWTRGSASLRRREGGAKGMRQSARAIPAELRIDRFESMDQVGNFTPRVRSARRRAEVRATAKWPVPVDEAVARPIVEQRTDSVRSLGQTFTPTRAQCLRRDERFAFREIRRPAS